MYHLEALRMTTAWFRVIRLNGTTISPHGLVYHFEALGMTTAWFPVICLNGATISPHGLVYHDLMHYFTIFATNC